MDRARATRTTPPVDERPDAVPDSREARLAAVVARVREDARTEPERYLESTEVPGGGE